MSTNPDAENFMPDDVVTFYLDLDDAVQRSSGLEIAILLDERYNQVIKQHFADGGRNRKKWPKLSLVEEKMKGKDERGKKAPGPTLPVTKLLYQYLYYFSLFQDNGKVSSDDMKLSWETFNGIFNLLLDPQCSINFTNECIWTFFDEFVYQLSAVPTMKGKARAWALQPNIEMLERIVKNSLIGGMIAENALADGPKHSKSAAGVFATIALMRVDVLIGDYRSALRRCTPLDVMSSCHKTLQTTVAAYISLYYNVGFSYLMLQRYVDACRSFRVTLSIQGSTGYSKKLQYHTTSLLAMTSVISGLNIDLEFLPHERAHAFEDAVPMFLQARSEEAFEEPFNRASPKFISLSMENGGYQELTGKEHKELQLRVFLRNVRQQLDIIRLRGYFGVYTTMTAQKLQSLLQLDGSVLAPLLGAKCCSRQIVHDGTSPNLLSGSEEEHSFIDFKVESGNLSLVEMSEKMTAVSDLIERVKELKQKELRGRAA